MFDNYFSNISRLALSIYQSLYSLKNVSNSYQILNTIYLYNQSYLFYKINQIRTGQDSTGQDRTGQERTGKEKYNVR